MEPGPAMWAWGRHAPGRQRCKKQGRRRQQQRRKGRHGQQRRPQRQWLQNPYPSWLRNKDGIEWSTRGYEDWGAQDHGGHVSEHQCPLMSPPLGPPILKPNLQSERKRDCFSTIAFDVIHEKKNHSKQLSMPLRF